MGSGCIAYRPRMLKYEQSPAAEPGAATATLTVSGEGALVQARKNDPWKPARTGDSVAPGSLMMTDSDSEVVVELPRGHGQVRLAHSTTVEFALPGGSEGFLFILSAGKVSGSVNGTPITIIGTTGGGLSLTPDAGKTAPFEVRHGRDERYFEVMRSLGLRPDWGNIGPSQPSAFPQDGDLFVFRTPNAASGAVVPEPSPIVLMTFGGAVLGLVWRKGRTG